MNESGRREMDIYLLTGMVCSDALKHSILRRVGANRTEAAMIRERISSELAFGPEQIGNFARLVGYTGPVLADSVITYRSVIWPQLDFVVVGEAGHWKNA
ncbi:hypothetical protein [Nocardia sp. NPDC058497]|uniref:hypothetical protein n=1 Tax=Nocardia sp. NPDC058497 TaxID=3346529 RepID=UPI0036566150